jgi:hypothetical protein
MKFFPTLLKLILHIGGFCFAIFIFNKKKWVGGSPCSFFIAYINQVSDTGS